MDTMAEYGKSSQADKKVRGFFRPGYADQICLREKNLCNHFLNGSLRHASQLNGKR